MQINPNDNVRAEGISPAAQIAVLPQSAYRLKSGEVIMAVVEQADNEAVVLRLGDGSLLRALPQGELMFLPGDTVEAAVGSNGIKQMLYILNITRAVAQPASEGAANPASQPTLSGMMTMLKRNPGMDATAALFLTENNIADTAENVTAVSQLARGTNIGMLLGQILSDMARVDEAVLPQRFASDQSVQPQNAQPAQRDAQPAGAQTQRSDTGAFQAAETLTTGAWVLSPVAEPATTAAGAAAPATETKPQAQANAMRPEGAAAYPRAEGLPLTQGTAAQGMEQLSATVPYNKEETPQTSARSVGMSPKTDVEPRAVQQGRAAVLTESGIKETEKSGENAHSNAQTGTTQPKTEPGAQQRTDIPLRDMIRGLFTRPDVQTGADMKKAACELPQMLKMLKSLLVQSDINNKELCLKSADQALWQTELADRAMRFEHMQLPFMLGDGANRAAELYVFRHRGGQKKPAEAGMTILVALDTVHIGHVETLIRESGGGISLEFRLEQPEMADVFKRSSALLEQAVEASGYRLKGVRFTGLEKTTTVLNAGETILPEECDTPRGIDVKV